MDDALPASTQTKICKRLFFWQLKKSWKSIFEIEQLSKQNQYRTHSDSGSSYLGTVWELQQRSPLEQSAPQLHRWSFLPNSSRQQKVSVRDAYSHPFYSTCSKRRSSRKHPLDHHASISSGGRPTYNLRFADINLTGGSDGKLVIRLVIWCLEPSQPQRIFTSGLTAIVNFKTSSTDM